MKKYFWLIVFLFLFCGTGQAELKKFFKAYPWGNTDTTEAWAQREIAWERSKGFSFELEGMADLPGAIRLLYDRPAIIMYRVPGDTAWFNAQAIVDPGKGESMYVWIDRNGYSIDSCYLHWDSTKVWQSAFFEAYDDTNDLDDDELRDFDPYCGLGTRYNVNWVVDTSADWTINEWIGKGIYDLQGNLLDTVEGNSAESLWYNVGDTTNLVVNPSFEGGDSAGIPTGWWGHGLVTPTVDSINPPAESLKSIRIPGRSGYWDVAIKQRVQTPIHCDYIFQVSYKTDAVFETTLLLKGDVVMGDSEGFALTEGILIVPESADGNWHTYREQFSNYKDSVIIYLGAFPNAWGDTSWNNNDSIWFDNIRLFPVQGLLPTWSSTGDFGENVTYYPFIIDSLDIYNHTSTAQSESLARCHSPGGGQYGVERPANLSYSGYRNFQKWWSAKIFDVRASEGFDGIFEDEMWGTAPNAGDHWWSREFRSGLTYPGVVSPMIRDSIWMRNYLSLLKSEHDTLHSLGKYIFINQFPDTEWVKDVDGFLQEGQDEPAYSMIASNFDSMYSTFANYPFTGRRNNLWRYAQMRNNGKLCLYFSTWAGGGGGSTNFEQSLAAETATRYDTNAVLGAPVYIAEFESTMAGRNRCRVSSLALYYLLSYDSSYYHYEKGEQYLPNEYYWAGIQDVDIGEPVDSAFEFTSGIDDSLIPYTIAGRKFYGGETGDTVLVLYKPKSYGNNWWGCYNGSAPPCSLGTTPLVYYNTDDTLTWDKFPATTHALGGTYLRYNWKGEFDPGLFSQISLRYNEGVILMKYPKRHKLFLGR